MAFRVFEEFARTQAQMTGQVTIYCDSTADIAALRTDYAPGSTAIVVTSGLPTYMLNASNTWVEV